MNREELFHEGEIWVAKDIFSAYMEDDFGLLPLPKGPDAENASVSSMTSPISLSWTVTRISKTLRNFWLPLLLKMRRICLSC